MPVLPLSFIKQKEMWSLFFRNLFFTVLQPGMVAGLIPYFLLGNPGVETFKHELTAAQYAAIFLFVLGIAILFYCITMFAVKGKGTLSPADPTKKLVVSGPYKFSRNPMYVGVLLILIGEALFFSSASMWVYTAFVFIAFYLFIVLHEEPRLEGDFGDEYKLYVKKVRRWL
jgi:protein-S-isoprenylcysteine O-methyltransferase Ste14